MNDESIEFEEPENESSEEQDDKPKKGGKKKYAYEGEVHLPGKKKPSKIRLTAEDLDPTKDPVIGGLFTVLNDPKHAQYGKMPGLREVINLLARNRKEITEQYARYRKRGRI